MAHPRSRGKNAQLIREEVAEAGSSPLTRGKRQLPCPRSSFQGLIPAHAGKTPSQPPRSDRHAAHPRSRGKNAQLIREEVAEAGSSPLTRGKRQLPCPRSSFQGLIPAHAGKTPSQPPRSDRHAAHPRSRGENWVTSHTCCDTAGSSPLTRGKRDLAEESGMREGLIPAHAGKT